jgi:membrane protein implicated in regulation of membrane protease activity
MDDFFAGQVHWLWWTLAVVFIVLEIFTPGTFFLFLGAAAVIVGVLVLFFPATGWEYPVLIFALLAVAIAVLGRQYLRRRPIKTDHPQLNRRGAQYVGRLFTLDEPIVNGSGRLKVDDTIWKISGADCPAQQQVKVVAVDGTVLRVEVVA